MSLYPSVPEKWLRRSFRLVPCSVPEIDRDVTHHTAADWKNSRRSVASYWLAAAAAALGSMGCTTTSSRVVFKDKGIVVTHTEQTDYALKMTGHGGYILEINSAVVFGKKYQVLAGTPPCFFVEPGRRLMFFVYALPGEGTSMFVPDRELHIVHLDDHTDTAIFLGQSHMGDDFGAHKAGTKYAEQVEFEGDDLVRITTYNGSSTDAADHLPYTKSVFVVSLAQKKLISESTTPIPH